MRRRKDRGQMEEGEMQWIVGRWWKSVNPGRSAMFFEDIGFGLNLGGDCVSEIENIFVIL